MLCSSSPNRGLGEAELEAKEPKGPRWDEAVSGKPALGCADRYVGEVGDLLLREAVVSAKPFELRCAVVFFHFDLASRTTSASAFLGDGNSLVIASTSLLSR